MKIAKKILDVSLVILSIISILVCGLYVYYHFFVNDTTIGVNNIGDQIGLDIINSEDLTEEEKSEFEERWFMEANYYSNDAGNGIELQELNFNYFMDYTLTSDVYRSTGMQYLGDYKFGSTQYFDSEVEVGKAIDPEFTYYDTVDGLSYKGYAGNNPELSIATLLNRDAELIIKIDNKPYTIQMTGKYDVYDRFLFWEYVSVTYYYGYSNVFESVMSAIKSNSLGYGDYYITVDLSEYFSIKEYDVNTGKFKPDDVTDIIKNYAVLKFHYYENGAKNSTQSIFGLIENNPNYGMSDVIDTTYWKAKAVYTYTESSDIFDLRYSSIYNGNLISFSSEARQKLEKLSDAKIRLTINITNTDIVGIDYSGLENIEIESITITGSGTFYCLENSLKGTNVKTINRSSAINLDVHATAIDTEYSEVIL
ncbi:MAG: hypothetical protein IKC49_03230 [Clostridia bacterium]|nr:hypothetical protein [Clostridia bacterium]